jgi:hypothetical protein
MPDERANQEVECLALPVEAPLTANFDPLTGLLTLESTVQRGVDDGRWVRLQLSFSPEAAHGFIRLLKAVESQLGVVLSDDRRAPLRQ